MSPPAVLCLGALDPSLYRPISSLES